jgi:dTDP-4-amino-4,6-dideoxygalactose transaminase
MAEDGIEARPMWKPMHQQPLFAECHVYNRHVADEIFECGLCLPSGSNLTEHDRERVVRSFRAALRGAKQHAA